MHADLFDFVDEPPRYPDRGGSKACDLDSPSRAAAARIPAATLRAPVLRDLREHGASTADLTIRPRFRELRGLGLIVPTSARRPSWRGTSSTVWRVSAQEGIR